jgi:uncharacterized SAM-binding protein YcdF (DUF218 family)
VASPQAADPLARIRDAKIPEGVRFAAAGPAVSVMARGLAVLLLAVGLFAAATAFLFVYPDADPVPRRADAIVVLSGGQHRLDEGVRLWREGVVPTLAISDGRNPGWPEANRLCGRPRVRCFDPSPYSTRGEARWTAEQGWSSVVVVTSTYHVRRARELFDRCVDGRLAVVEADPPVDNFIVGVAWEWPKSAWYWGLSRGC